MTVNAVAFDAAALVAVALGVAAAVLQGRRGALATGGCLAAVGVLSAVAGAELTGAVEVAVGAGVALALHRGPGGTRVARLPRWRRPAAGLVAAGLAALVLAVAAVSTGAWRSAPYPRTLADQGTARAVAERLVGTYSLPLAATAVLLLAATVVAVVLARRDEREAAHDRAVEERRRREERMRRRREDRARARAGRRDTMAEPVLDEGES